MNIIKQIDLSGIYIVHGITGYELREKMLTKLLGEEYGLEYEFVTESLDAEENEAWITRFFKNNIRYTLTRGGIYCTLVHFLIYERFIKSKNKYAVIFENDVCFLGAFTAKMPLIIDEADLLPEGFIISLENSTLNFPSWRKTKKNKYLYEANKGRCAGAYLIDQKAAQLMLDDLKKDKCGVVIDWWHNDLINRKIIKMYWAHPPLTEQGSFNGNLPSSISVRANGGARRWKWLLQKFYKMYVIRLIRG